MKADMEVLPGFNALDPYAMPKLDPRKQALFDNFAPREELWSTLEHKLWYTPEERIRNAWNRTVSRIARSRIGKEVWRKVRWWVPLPLFRLTGHNYLNYQRLALEMKS